MLAISRNFRMRRSSAVRFFKSALEAGMLTALVHGSRGSQASRFEGGAASSLHADRRHARSRNDGAISQAKACCCAARRPVSRRYVTDRLRIAVEPRPLIPTRPLPLATHSRRSDCLRPFPEAALRQPSGNSGSGWIGLKYPGVSAIVARERTSERSEGRSRWRDLGKSNREPCSTLRRAAPLSLPRS
jgi:hypothetical protein